MEKILLPNLIRICIDSYQTEAATGRVYTPTSKTPIHFHDWGKLMVDVDCLFDTIGYPQAFQCKRTFNKEKEMHGYRYKPEAVVEEDWFISQKGAIATFNVYIHSRQFSSWQGDLCDETNQPLEHFSDALELLKFIFSKMDHYITS